MNTLRKFAAIFLLLAACYPVDADHPEGRINPVDWSKEATVARNNGLPLMVIFSADFCPYCHRLRKEVLEPLIESGKLKNRVLLKEFNIDSPGKVIDFDGDPIRSRVFVRRYEIYATPTVIFLDYEGEPLTDPIIGFNGPESYTEHLDEAISTAVMTLAALRSPRFATLDR